MTFEDQKNILQCLRDVLEIAYNSAEPVCCGRPGVECCGSPEPEWRAFEQTIMDTLGPAEKALAESVQAAANQQGILDGSDHVSDASKMVPEMLPIAQRKIEQMGGEVMGVVVRNEAGALAAVTDMGRVTWLDDAVAGPVGDGAQGAEPVTEADAPAYLWDKNGRYGWAIGMNTKPDAKVPDEPTEAMFDAAMSEKDRQHPANAKRYLAYVWRRMLAAAPTTPQQSGEWVRCGDRLPTEDDADCSGEVWVFDLALGVAAEYYENVCDLPDYAYWMPTGLKRPNPPKQEGSGDE